ncbi:ABC transporter substrate-binding protein [Halalkalibacter urbisdiaboli]|uniref:ABC transporter substrate-binding protein n=1 Tax=Halalkalibacter urbisdiaboli TaxID=1960589 RepID=UPI000B44BABB|nr:ABC transporter substrate-binding protein [Halalkalibacter urbisdiaboli]
MKILKGLVLLSLLLFIMAACNSNEAEEGTQSPNVDEATDTPTEVPNVDENQELTEVEVMLDWYPNAVHTFLYVAIENGYFAEEGLDVKLVFPANPTDPINLTASGANDFALSYQPDILLAQEQGLPLASVAPIVRSPLNHVMFLTEKGYTRPADLEGKTVGYPGIPLNEAILKTMVESDGGDFSKVDMIDVGFELGAAITSERADAIIGAYINHEYPVLKHEGYDISYFNPEEFGVPSYYELVLITNETMMNENSDLVDAFWRAAVKGYEETKANPEESLHVLLSNQDQANFPLIEEVEKESLEILLSKMESADEAFGSQEQEHWDEVKTWLDETK